MPAKDVNNVVLVDFFSVYYEILIKRNRQNEAALFISQKQGKRLTRRSVELIIETIAGEAGV